jgi:hypothetical protein
MQQREDSPRMEAGGVASGTETAVWADELELCCSDTCTRMAAAELHSLLHAAQVRPTEAGEESGRGDSSRCPQADSHRNSNSHLTFRAEPALEHRGACCAALLEGELESAH